MTDIVDKATRSRMMSGIRGKNTKPEVLVRKALHAAGFRFRIHVDTLPGKPDIVLPRYRAVIFVHGCFWHGHDCAYFRLPQSNTAFWQAKIEANRLRDLRSIDQLKGKGWKVLVLWECAVRHRKGNTERPGEIIRSIADWLRGDVAMMEISSERVLRRSNAAVIQS